MKSFHSAFNPNSNLQCLLNTDISFYLTLISTLRRLASLVSCQNFGRFLESSTLRRCKFFLPILTILNCLSFSSSWRIVHCLCNCRYLVFAALRNASSSYFLFVVPKISVYFPKTYKLFS